MGDSLMGPSQVKHALKVCQEAEAWFLLSFWGAEDAPLSHYGGAHGFDINGAHHVHLLSTQQGHLLIEEANALHSTAGNGALGSRLEASVACASGAGRGAGGGPTPS